MMLQRVYSKWTDPVQIDLNGQWQAGLVVVHNFTARTIYLGQDPPGADGTGAYDVIPAYYPKSIAVPNWSRISFQSDGATLQTGDTLTLSVFEKVGLAPPPLPATG